MENQSCNEFDELKCNDDKILRKQYENDGFVFNFYFTNKFRVYIIFA